MVATTLLITRDGQLAQSVDEALTPMPGCRLKVVRQLKQVPHLLKSPELALILYHETSKEQQAEVLVGMLDAYAMFGKQAYWGAFENVYHFVFDKFVNLEAGGEWYERLDRMGNSIDDALGHAWKISYHTVRSVIQSIKRLELLVC